jgi:hypothetical protein
MVNQKTTISFLEAMIVAPFAKRGPSELLATRKVSTLQPRTDQKRTPKHPNYKWLLAIS